MKISIKKLAILSLLMALGVVFKFFSIGTDSFRISIWDIPLFMAGVLAGPIYGGIVAMGADLIYGLCFSQYPFSFIMMFTTIVWGVSGGLFKYIKISKYTIIPLYFLILATSIFATAINSVYLVTYQGINTMLAGLPFRLLVMFIKWPITSTLIYILYKSVFEKVNIR